MRLRLWHRLFLAFAVLSAVTLIGFVAWQQWNFREGFASYLDAVARQRLQAASERLGEAYREKGDWTFLAGDPHSFERYFDPFGARHGGVGPDESPPRDFASSRPEPPGMAAERNGEPNVPDGPPPPDGAERGGPNGFATRARVLLVDAHNAIIAGDPRIAHEAMPMQVPIEVDGRHVGTLFARAAPRHLFAGPDLIFASAQRDAAVLAGAVALLAALLLAFAVARGLLAPIRALTRGMHALTAGDFGQRVQAASSDELGVLGRDFNQLAQTLEQHRDARRRWGADIAHELRTPLSVLQGEIAALQDGVRAATPAALDSLQLECARLSGLIEDLYQLSLADAGALEYRFETLDLADLVGETLELSRRASLDAGLALEWAAPEHSVAVRGDARRLAQLIDNLLANARRYTDAPGRIRIALSATQTAAQLSIDDTPPGVPDAALPHLFERLYRVEDSRSRASGGAGLGLAICRAIVEAHAGRIVAAPSPLGGLRIVIELPLASDNAA